ncbi:MAG: efflux RND transporter periplasmic adaptor subunit [Bacteroidales bacterium]
MKKNIIIISVVFVLLGSVIYTLKGNKQAIQQEISDAERTYDYIAVKVQKILFSDIESNISASGRLSPYNELNILSEVNGKILKINKEKGQSVSKGETLAIVDPEIYKAQYESAKAQYNKLEKDLKRYEKLVEKEAITKNELEKARLGVVQAKSQMIIAKKNYDNTYIQSPISGIINNDFIEIGEFIAPGKSLYEVVNTNKLKLNTTVGESDVMNIHIGDQAKVSISLYPNTSFDASVNAVAENADNYYRYNIELILDNSSEKKLKGGMYAEVSFPSKKRQGLMVDRNAIVGGLKNPKVFVAEDSMAKKRSVTIGFTNDKYVEIKSGLNLGDQVIVSGQINLKEGTKIKVIE